MNFMESVKNTLVEGEHNVSVTENGAIGYRTSGKALLDLNFAVSTLRYRDDWELETMFANACAEDLDLAVVWLVFARDCRGGLGERRLFRVCMRYLAREFPEKAVKIVPLIAEYGRWDDVLDLFFETTNQTVKKAAFDVFSTQLNNDLKALRDGKPVSLLAKWAPSANTSSHITRREARQLAQMLGVTERKYRQNRSALRRRIDVVESKMSARRWGEINYEGVPSKANLLYRDAFMKHDGERRKAFLDSLKKDPTKIKASVLFPHEIVHEYDAEDRRTNVDDTLEALWKNLPNVFGDSHPNILVVADGSGSMTWSGDGVMPLDIANALAIYFADKLSPAYRDKYITFSDNPQYVDLSGATTLLGKLRIALEHDECASTNIEAVFHLILQTAHEHLLTQDELPDTILILSDGEFNAMTSGRVDVALFDSIRDEFALCGYQLPKLAFWNISSRTMTVPIRQNELGVALISGYSPSVMKIVMSGELDPYKALLSVLAGDRYRPVRDALKGV